MEYAKNTSIERAHAILRALSQFRDGLSFSSLQQQIGNPVAATLSRLLKALQAEGLVIHDESAYKCGPGMLSLAENCLGRSQLQEIQAALDQLAELSGQSSLCCKSVHRDGIYYSKHIAKHECDEGLHFSKTGTEQRFLAQAYAWPLLNALSSEEKEKIINEHLQRSGEARERVLNELNELQNSGVLARGERHQSHPLGCTRIVAPVFINKDAYSIGITVFGRSDNGLSDEQIQDWCDQVRRSAQKLEQDLYRD